MKRTFSVVLGIMALSALALGAAPVVTWHATPAGHANIESYAVDSSGHCMVVSLLNAGMWRTENGGETWQPLQKRTVYNLQMAGAGGDTLLGYTLSDSAVYGTNVFSYDGGRTWQPFADDSVRQSLGAYSMAGRFALPAHFPHCWLFLRDTGFYRSTDYGRTWSDTTFDATLQGIFQDPLRDSTLYLTFSRQQTYELPGERRDSIHQFIYRSSDLGETWDIFQDKPSAYVYRYNGENDQHLYMPGLDTLIYSDSVRMISYSGDDPNMCSMSGLVLSTDQGRSWRWTENLTPPQWPNHFAADRFRPGRLLLAASCRGGVKRLDSGDSLWHDGLNGLPAEERLCLTLRQNPYSGLLSAKLVKGEIYLSRDRGDTWQAMPLPRTGHSSGEFSVTPQAVFYYDDPLMGDAEFPFRLWEYYPSSDAWHELAAPDRFVREASGKVIFTSGDTLLAGSWSCCLTRSFDHGITWQHAPSLDGYFDADCARNDSMFHVLCSADTSEPLIAPTNLLSHWSTSPNKAGQDFQFARSGDSLCVFPISWTDTPADVYLSTDLGENWTLLDAPHDEYCAKLLLAGTTIFFVGKQEHHLFRYSQGQWRKLPDLPFAPLKESDWLDVALIPGENPVLVGTGKTSPGLWVSRNLGETWQRMNFRNSPFSTSCTPRRLTYDPYRHRLWGVACTGPGWIDERDLLHH